MPIEPIQEPEVEINLANLKFEGSKVQVDFAVNFRDPSLKNITLVKYLDVDPEDQKVSHIIYRSASECEAQLRLVCDYLENWNDWT